MADNCFVKFNENINVNLIKVSKNTTLSFNEAIRDKEQKDTNMVLFSDFTNSVDAYYLSPEDIVSGAVFSIYKKTPNQEYYDYVCQLSDGAYEFYDYNIRNDQYYHYLASVELETSQPDVYDYQIYENSLNGIPEYFHVRFDEWTICNIEETEDEYVYKKTGDMWTLGLNFEDETITQGLNITQWNTLGKYNRVSIGQKKCESGTFSGLLGLMKEYTNYYFTEHGTSTEYERSPQTVYQYTEKKEYYDKETKTWKINGTNHKYSTEMDKLMAWKDFCSDGELKLLRDIKGNAWIVQIVDAPSYNIENKSNLKQTKITFAWQEVKDINSCSIIVTGAIEK